MSQETPEEPAILCLGTKVVVKVPIAGNMRAYPAGTMAEIVEAPDDPSHTYRLRLPDGYETQMHRRQFVLLRTMQEAGLNEQRVALQDRGLTDCVVYKCIVGSRAYGLEIEDSDTDTRGIYLAPAERHWSLYGVPQQLENPETDEVYWELQKFLVLALKANPNILEVLYSPLIVETTPVAEELLAIRGEFLSKLVFQTYNGYVMSQFKKLSRRRERGLEPKWKHAMHLIRLLLSGIRTLEEEAVPVKVPGEYRERLLAIRSGAIAFDEIDAWRLRLHDDFVEAYEASRLPEQPNYEAANALLVRARREAAK